MTNLSSLSPEDQRVFLQEIQEQIQLMDEDIIRLEKESDDVELIQEIFRAAHTLKGSSSMVGFTSMAQLTHAMEDLLDRVRKRTLNVTSELVDALLLGLDGLKQLRENLAEDGDLSLDVSGLVAALEHASGGHGDGGQPETVMSLEKAISENPQARSKAAEAVAKGLPVYRVNVTISRRSEWAAVRCFQVLAQLTSMAEVFCSVPSESDIEQEQVQADFQALIATEAGEDAIRQAITDIDDVEAVGFEPWSPDPVIQAATRAPAGAAEIGSPKIEALQTVRIDIETLDSLMNMVGELVIDRTRVTQISRKLSHQYRDDETVGQLTTTTTHLAKVVDELNQKMMQARMLPVGLLFNKFPRMVRDLARSLNKDIDFVMDGADTEIDRSVIERVKDPLVHILRNAIDHGLETPEERLSAGKTAKARVELSAHHEQGHIYITVSDDGRGIDTAQVRATAIQRGMLTAEAAERLSEAEALDLISEAGFSTARTTTEVSGRGVGMDVVQRSIGELGGLIKIDTALGKGTTFTLRLPLTLAIFRGLLVSAQGTPYAIPLTYVQEAVMLEEAAVQRVMGSEVLNLRGKVMPLLRLNSDSLLGKNSGLSSLAKFVVVLRSENKLLGLAVDDLLEQQEVVVKPIGSLANRTRGVAGASILGDGRVALILDITSLIRTSAQGANALVDSERKAA